MEIIQLLKLSKKHDNVEDETISVSFGRSLDDLQKAIQTHGILSPILVRKAQNAWQIVSGQARWRCACQDFVPAIEISCDDKEALSIYIYENQIRGFNPVECAKIIYRLHYDLGFSLKEISDSYACLIGIPSGVKILKDYLSILDLSDIILKRIAQGKLPVKNAIMLFSFSREESIILMQWSDLLGWSGNKQRESFQWIWEICKKEGCSVSELLSKKEFQVFMEKEKPNPELFRQELNRRKNPQLSSAQQAFEQILKDQNVSSVFSIKPSNSYEKNNIHLEWDCNSLEDFQKGLDILKKLQESKAIEKLFQITAP